MSAALVVGGAGGLGRAIVQRLLDRGRRVIVAGRSASAAPGVERSYVVDATKVAWDAFLGTAQADAGTPIDAIVFVAGTAAFGRTARIPAERARSVLELNFWACAGAATAAAERWAAAGRAGTFVAVLSIVARRAVPFEAYYAASKAAAARFLECLDLEYGTRGARFVAAYPGTLETGFRRTADWHALDAAPGRGSDPAAAARAIVGLLEGTRQTRVIGWRERSIDLADRVAPGLYDRVVLRRRVRRTEPG
jgi:short-subunit dehydrogenase